MLTGSACHNGDSENFRFDVGVRGKAVRDVATPRTQSAPQCSLFAPVKAVASLTGMRDRFPKWLKSGSADRTWNVNRLVNCDPQLAEGSESQVFGFPVRIVPIPGLFDPYAGASSLAVRLLRPPTARSASLPSFIVQIDPQESLSVQR